jgi:hypothetical protein
VGIKAELTQMRLLNCVIVCHRQHQLVSYGVERWHSDVNSASSWALESGRYRQGALRCCPRVIEVAIWM